MAGGHGFFRNLIPDRPAGAGDHHREGRTLSPKRRRGGRAPYSEFHGEDAG